MSLPKQKTYRFFYHYFRGKKAMSVHFRGTCYVVDDVKCWAYCETKWRPRQPNLIMQGYASQVNIEDGIAYIQ